MLRVSTNTFYRTGQQNIIDRQGDLLAAQTQLSSGKRINSPADDPVGAADATSIRAGISQFRQFKDNQDHARYLLNMGESALAGIIGSVQDVSERLVQAGNGSLNDNDRASLATDLEGTLARMVGLANSADGAGGYLFAGSRESTAPFAQSGNTVSFFGDQILQKIEVANNRLQQVKFSGDALFLKIRAGNGSFTTDGANTNTGTGTINVGTVTNPAALTGRPYAINFAVAGSVTSYTVVRSNANGTTTNVAAGAYTSPQAIQFDGIQVTVSGAPANTDRFDVAPSQYQSVFDTMARAIATLRAPVRGNGVAGAQYTTDLGQAQASMQQALDHLVTRRSEIGTALSELDAYGSLNDDRQLAYDTRLSIVEDLDYAKGVSELARKQQTFEAALASYSKVSKLTLFDYI
jgi:flagellar hook-associated protein 3 FlgL